MKYMPSLYVPRIVILATVVFSVMIQAQIIRPLSKNWYRLPYDDNIAVTAHGDNHAINGHNGHDFWATPYIGFPSPYTIVAAADGVVVRVTDANNECGDGGCNNSIWIMHANGEYSAYYHIAFASALVDSGDAVVAGQPIATEGDVGNTTGSGTPNRLKLDCDGVQDPADTTFCGVHLHFAVSDSLSSMDPVLDLLNPRICGNELSPLTILGGYQYADSTNLPCDASACYEGLTQSGTWEDTLAVAQASDDIESTAIIDNSVIGLQAGGSITLSDGFHARDGAYFRAEIGPCNTTTASQASPFLAAMGRARAASAKPEESEEPNTLLSVNAQAALPDKFALDQNFPNPFNPNTRINYALKSDVYVSLKIFNILGEELLTLVDEYQQAGFRSVDWNGRNAAGQRVASGIYVYRIRAGHFSQSRKMLISK